MKQKLSNDILSDINDINRDEEITLEDIEDIEVFLKTQPLIEPPENLFDDIMEAVQIQYEEENIVSKINCKKDIYSIIKNLLLNVKHQISLLDKRFWIASFIILFFGYISLKTSGDITIILLGPIVSVFSIYYLYRGRWYNVFEMELACKYSMYEVTVARTIVIIAYNIVFATILAIINYMMWHTNIWAFLILTWLSPLLMSYYFTIYFFYKKGIIYSVIANVVTWVLYVSSFQFFLKISQSNQSYAYVSGIYNNTMWININLILILVSTIMLGLLFKNIKRNYG